MQGFATWGAADAPFQVTSSTEFEEKAGPRSATFPMLYDAAMEFFRRGGKRLYINRTAGVGAAQSTVTIQANATDTLVLKGRYKGARGNTIARKITRTSFPAGTATTLAAGSATVIPVASPGRFSVGDQVSFTTVPGADVKRGIVAAINGNTLVLAGAITVPVGGYDTTTLVAIEAYSIAIYDNNELKKTYTSLQTSPLSTSYFVTVIGNDDYRLIEATLFSPAPTFAANVDTRPASDTDPVLLTGGSDGATITDTDIKGTSSAHTGVWAWDGERAPLFLSMPGIMSIASVTVGVYKEAEVYEMYRQAKQPFQFIVDPPQGLSPSGMKTWWTTTFAPTSRGIAGWFPWIRTRDSVTNALIARPPSGYIMGLIANAHQKINMATPPAGEYGIISGVIGTDLDSPLQEGDAAYDDLYSVGVNGILKFDDAPAKAFGNTTADVKGSFGEFHAVTVFNVAAREIRNRTGSIAFKGNTAETRSTVTRLAQSLFRGWWTPSRNSILDGATEEEAFYVICNESNNPPSVRANKRMRTTYGLNVVHCVEVLEQTLEQDTRALESEIGLGQLGDSTWHVLHCKTPSRFSATALW